MEHDEFSPHERAPAPLVRRPAPLVGVSYVDPRIDRDRKNRIGRAAARGSEFIGECGKHGETLFDTQSGGCLSCIASLLGEGLPVLVAYRAAGATLYPKACPEHGPAAMHVVQTGRCADCFAEERGDPGRVRARRAGLPSYPAHCDRCAAVTEFSVSRGLCLSCFTVSGRVRKNDPHASARETARREYRRTFDAHCDRCASTTPHSVGRGLCTVCYTVAGVPRNPGGQGGGDPARVAARAAGLTTYQSTCSIHGATAFHTTRGKCLRCFNTLGQPRKRDP